MANFTPKRIDLTQINGGQRYGYEGISPEAINRPIEASAYAQAIAERALELAKSSESGEVTLGAYPIGSIYSSSESTSPALLFGGTWEQQTRYIEYGVHGTKVISSIQANSFYFMNRTDIQNLFKNKFGVAPVGAEFEEVGIILYNGDYSANAGIINGFAWSGTNLKVFHDLTGGIPARINYSYLFSKKDPMYYWKRIA